jgi:rhamnose transport system ATP-binding protein
MDEPTASLDEWEAQRLLGVVAALRTEGVGVIYVSHRMPEILQIADVITVMRDGRAVAHGPSAQFDETTLVTNMLGRSLARLAKRESRARSEVAISARGFSRHGKFAGIDLEVRAGEVVGMAGLVGSGRSEFAQSVFGHSKRDSGTLAVSGSPVSIRSVRQAIALGVGYVPEERQSQGLFLSLSSKRNVSVAALRRIQTSGVVSKGAEDVYVTRALKSLQIKNSIELPVETLSGGNQQKILLGRWLALEPRVLILDEPTRGIDVGTRAEIYRLIDDLTKDGIAILLISSDLQELLQLSDRVVVMRNGSLVAEFSGDDLTEINIGGAALGAPATPGATE